MAHFRFTSGVWLPILFLCWFLSWLPVSITKKIGNRNLTSKQKQNVTSAVMETCTDHICHIFRFWFLVGAPVTILGILFGIFMTKRSGHRNWPMEPGRIKLYLRGFGLVDLVRKPKKRPLKLNRKWRNLQLFFKILVDRLDLHICRGRAKREEGVLG